MAHLALLADDLEGSARHELAVAGVPEDRMRLEWSLLLVYPGQTFDTAIACRRADRHARAPSPSSTASTRRPG